MFGLTQLQERIVWIGIIIVAFLGYTWYERHVGAKECIQNVIASNTKEGKKEDIQHGKDITETQKEGQAYETAKNEPIAPAPIIRLGVCPTLHHEAGSAAPVSGRIPNAEASIRTENQELPPVIRWDTEPVVRAGHEADAQITGLQKYILNVCRPGS